MAGISNVFAKSAGKSSGVSNVRFKKAIKINYINSFTYVLFHFGNSCNSSLRNILFWTGIS